MNQKFKCEYPDFKGIGYSKIGFFKEIRSKIKELESLNIELARRHNKLEAIFNSINDGLTILDRDLNIVFVNQVQKANFPNATFIGKKCFQAIFQKKDVCDHCPAIQTIKSQENYTGEIYVKDDDDGGRYYEWTTSPVRDLSGRVYEIILLMRDITDRKEYEYKLMRADRMAAVGFLAAGVAHEINNPLTSIAGFSEALIKRLKRSKSEQDIELFLASFEEYLTIINEEAYRCKDIISNLQDFSRNSSDDFKDIAIDAIIRNTLSLFRQRAKDHDITVHYNTYLESGTDVINGKKSQLKHLFLNLLVRAFNCVEDGGSLSLQLMSNTRYVKVSLLEIEHEEKGRWAEPSTSHASDFSSSNNEVDLSICYNIVQHHSGMMQFELSDEIGNILAIYFPKKGFNLKEGQDVTESR